MRGPIIALFCLLMIPQVLAVSISLNPANLDFPNMQRGGYGERIVTLSTGSDEDTTVLSFYDQQNELFDWITFEPNTTSFVISRDSPYELKVIIEPPEDIPNGNYNGTLRFRIQATDRFKGQTGSVIEVGVAARIIVGISDEEITDCQIISSGVTNIEQGDNIPFRFSLINNGNIRLTPEIEIDIWNKAQTKIEKSVVEDTLSIQSTIRDEFNVLVKSDDLDADQYFADISIDVCDYQETLTFDVLKPGSITVSGRLIKIENRVWNNVNDEIQTSGLFENTGVQTVSAEFRGGVYLNEELIETFQSGFKQVSPGQTSAFPILFTPKEPGRYVVKGRMYYENKQTFEKTNIINVNPKDISYDGTGAPLGSTITWYWYIGIGVVLVLLLIIIKSKKSTT